MGRFASISFTMRLMCNMFAVVLEVAATELGGTYWADSRKDLMFDILRSEDAEGESRMMGSGRFCF